jgi:hypothetical protein
MALPNSSSPPPSLPNLPNFGNTSSFGNTMLAFSTNFNPLATGTPATTPAQGGTAGSTPAFSNPAGAGTSQLSAQPGSFGANLFSGAGAGPAFGTTPFGSSAFGTNTQTNNAPNQQQNTFTSLI